MFKPIARFVLRDDGEGSALGLVFCFDTSVLKPNTIYQINAVMDELQVQDMGVSMISSKRADDKTPQVYGCNWNMDISHIVSCTGTTFILTQQEYVANEDVVDSRVSDL